VTTKKAQRPINSAATHGPITIQELQTARRHQPMAADKPTPADGDCTGRKMHRSPVARRPARPSRSAHGTRCTPPHFQRRAPLQRRVLAEHAAYASTSCRRQRPRGQKSPSARSHRPGVQHSAAMSSPDCSIQHRNAATPQRLITAREQRGAGCGSRPIAEGANAYTKHSRRAPHQRTRSRRAPRSTRSRRAHPR
jgi:hypothetical protein